MERMKWRLGGAALALATCLTSGAVIAAAPQAVADHWYGHMDDGPWCAYPNEKARTRAANEAGSYDLANAAIVEGKVAWLAVTASSESGDWVVFDDYDLVDGRISALHRQSNDFEYGTLVEEFVVKAGRLVRKSQILYEMGTKKRKPMQKGVDYGVEYGHDVTGISDIKKAGFYPVLLATPKTKPVCNKR